MRFAPHKALPRAKGMHQPRDSAVFFSKQTATATAGGRRAEKQLRKIKHKPGELPRDCLIRFQKKLIELEDAAAISGTQSNYHIISSVPEQAKQSTKGMSSEFKQQLKVQMHARQVVSFDTWSQYLKFVTSVQRAVQSDDGSSTHHRTMEAKMPPPRRSFVLLSQQAGGKHPRICFQTALSPAPANGQ